MLNLLKKRCVYNAAVAIAFTVLLPVGLSAQNSGVAGDGTMRLMWRATDSSISLWRLDSSNNINFLSSRAYGPYYGWQPIALTTSNDGESYVLWQHTNGTISIWEVNSNLDYVSSRQYGPYDGWLAVSLSVETQGPGHNRFRVIWRATDGKVSNWIVDSALNFVNNHVFGPFFGYTPSPGTAAARPVGSETDAKAAAAMQTPAAVPTAMPGVQ